MGFDHALYLYAICVGIAVSGFIGSLWALIAGERPQFSDLLEGDFLTPIKVPVVVLHAPIMILYQAGLWLILRPPVGVCFLILGLFWSFLQGVFILTQVFGLQ